MARSSWWALVGISCCLVAAPVRADQLRMECQVATGEPLGGYSFSFDTVSGSLSTTLQPTIDVHLMFAWDVKRWKLLLARGGHAVFYDIAADTPGNQVVGPVKILSLNFEKPNMFTYWMGGETDEAKIPPYQTKCRRLN